MRRARSPHGWWRFLALPLTVWLVLAAGSVTGLLGLQHRSREGVAQRFGLRIGLMGDFVTSYVADVLARERVQAQVFLADPVVSQRDFTRTVAAFGYPAAVLLDGHGRVLQVVPTEPSLIGTDLTDRYPHMRTAVADSRPAVSAVVPSAARRIRVVGFAVPFDSSSGRRVFNGAMEIARSPLASYLATALSLRGVRVQLADTTGAIVAANQTSDTPLTTMRARDPALASALAHHQQGRYRSDGHWWRYSARSIPGTPWQLSATVTEDVLFASVKGNETAGRAAAATATAVGLLVVLAAGRARRNRHALDYARAAHETELAERNRQLQQANTQMTDFIAMLTHDVRQPLSNIVAAGELLLDDWTGLDDHTRSHYVKRMTAAGHRASHLVGEILTLAQLDAGALIAYPTRVDTARLAREAVAAHTITPDQTITVTAPEDSTALADPGHLQLMLGNLLANASKYGAPPITVTITHDPEHVYIQVTDHGEGVPAAFVPNLFNRFTRADTGIATTKPGTGLGLYLVRQLAEAGGITINYQPRTPHGSVFTLTLPRLPATATTPARTPATTSSTPG